MWLAVHFGARRLPKVLSVLLGAMNEFPITGFIKVVLVFGFFYAAATLHGESSKLRPNQRYAISAIAGIALAVVLISIIATLTQFTSLLKMMNPEIGRGLGQLVLIGIVAALIVVVRRFAMEIRPGLGYCHHCGYDVRFLGMTQCPECGERIAEFISVRAVRTESDLALVKRSPLAVVYLQNPKDKLEECAWVDFVHQIEKNIKGFPGAELYTVDVSQPWVKQWLESSSQDKKNDPFVLNPASRLERVAFVVDGVVLTSVSRFLVGYYLSHGPQSLPGFELFQEKPARRVPAHFPNSFKKSSCIGRPSSLLFPYKH